MHGGDFYSVDEAARMASNGRRNPYEQAGTPIVGSATLWRPA